MGAMPGPAVRYARDARAEAQRVLGPDLEPRVLEPSPPAVTEPPWFADDPVAVDVGAARPVVSPVAGGDRTWDDWLVHHPAHRGWASDRWLGARRRLGDRPDDFAATRLALHLLASHVVSPARRRAGGKIGLRWTLGGFGTPFFGADEQVRVVGTTVVVQRGGQARSLPVTSLAAAAAFVLDDEPDVAWARRFDIPPAGDVDAPLDLDAAAAAWLGEWFGFATAVLETVRADPQSEEASRPQLWPEHFDIAFECLSEAAGRRAGFGVSPGDAAHQQPYLYVSLWSPGTVGPSPLWNAVHFRGAVLPLSELLAAPDQFAAATAFLRTRRDALRSS